MLGPSSKLKHAMRVPPYPFHCTVLITRNRDRHPQVPTGPSINGEPPSGCETPRERRKLLELEGKAPSPRALGNYYSLHPQFAFLRVFGSHIPSFPSSLPPSIHFGCGDFFFSFGMLGFFSDLIESLLRLIICGEALFVDR